MPNRPFRICPKCKERKPSYVFARLDFDCLCSVCSTSASAAKQREALPCLNRNISAESASPQEKVKPIGYQKYINEGLRDNINGFTTANKKSEFCLFENVKSFIDHFGIEKCGFLTLTFADQCADRKESQRRFNSLNKHFIGKNFDGYIKVFERMKSGAVHYHLIVACKTDIRRSFDFKQVKRRNYSSACLGLRNLWASMRENLPKYNFGRAELMPIKTNSKGLAQYVAKYIGKHISQRIEADKGARLVQTSIDKTYRWKIATSNFAFYSPGSIKWRSCLKSWVLANESYFAGYAKRVNGWVLPPIDENNYSEILTGLMGCKWTYCNLEAILSHGDI